MFHQLKSSLFSLATSKATNRNKFNYTDCSAKFRLVPISGQEDKASDPKRVTRVRFPVGSNQNTIEIDIYSFPY